jgi:hypothetical protein
VFKPDVSYVLRPGGYAIVSRDDAMIAVRSNSAGMLSSWWWPGNRKTFAAATRERFP